MYEKYLSNGSTRTKEEGMLFKESISLQAARLKKCFHKCKKKMFKN
jgi:hypothetical protein